MHDQSDDVLHVNKGQDLLDPLSYGVDYAVGYLVQL